MDDRPAAGQPYFKQIETISMSLFAKLQAPLQDALRPATWNPLANSTNIRTERWEFGGIDVSDLYQTLLDAMASLGYEVVSSEPATGKIKVCCAAFRNYTAL